MEYLELKNNCGLKAVISTFGAGVKSLTLNGNPLILEVKDEKDYLNAPQLFGKTVSRFIGRVNSHFILNGEELNLKEDSNGICLHGGYLEGLTFKDYLYRYEEDEDSSSLILNVTSLDGDCGFPGNLNLEVTYKMIKNSNSFQIYYKAVSDKDTIISISNHMYWNLNRDSDVSSYSLKINSSKCGKVKDSSLLIDGVMDVPPYLDFQTASNLGKKLDEIEKEIPDIYNLDHTFIFDKKINEADITLENNKYKIECTSSFNAANVFVNNNINQVEMTNTNLVGEKRVGIAIEPQQFPLNPYILRKNEVYNQYIIYNISEVK